MSSSNYSDENKWDVVGQASIPILKWAASEAQRSQSLLNLAQRIETRIKEEGFDWAFPVNLSMDAFAAHDTPAPDDKRAVGGLLKIDIGVMLNGYISDLAMTVDLTGEYGKLVEAAEECFYSGLAEVRAGVPVKRIGAAIEQTAKRYGFRPIANLGGHQIKQYKLHAGLFVPNISKGDGLLHEGDIIAIEPFVTTGEGWVVEDNYTQIYSLNAIRPRTPVAKRIYERMAARRGLPFAARWIADIPLWRLGLRQLKPNAYPRLREMKNGLVAQFERTVVVEKDAGRIIGENS